MVENHNAEIMSLSGANGSIQTMPRRRRPRARGEVYVTSNSKIYLSEPPVEASNAITATPTSLSDPIYQNTEHEKQNCITNEVYQNIQSNTVDVYRVRVNVLESDKVEIQQVAAFIDGIIRYNPSALSLINFFFFFFSSQIMIITMSHYVH